MQDTTTTTRFFGTRWLLVTIVGLISERLMFQSLLVGFLAWPPQFYLFAVAPTM